MMLNALFHSTRVLLTTVFLLILPVLAFGQGSTPSRGFQPGGSYALSDIENINTTNGNADQKRRGVDMYGKKPEQEASCSTVPIIRIMKLSESIIQAYEYDCLHGHGEWGPGPKKKPEKKKTKQEEK